VERFLVRRSKTVCQCVLKCFFGDDVTLCARIQIRQENRISKQRESTTFRMTMIFDPVTSVSDTHRLAVPLFKDLIRFNHIGIFPHNLLTSFRHLHRKLNLILPTPHPHLPHRRPRRIRIPKIQHQLIIRTTNMLKHLPHIPLPPRRNRILKR